jgi:hypothetical protein
MYLAEVYVNFQLQLYMFPVSQEVNCYSSFDSGNCDDLWLLGEVTMDDCCLNPHYGYIGADRKCKSCGWVQSNTKCSETRLVSMSFRFEHPMSQCRMWFVVFFDTCRPPSWSEWTAWGRCSVSCKEGVSQRRRECQGQGKCAQTTTHREIQKLALETKVCIDSSCCPGTYPLTDREHKFKKYQKSKYFGLLLMILPNIFKNKANGVSGVSGSPAQWLVIRA